MNKIIIITAVIISIFLFNFSISLMSRTNELSTQTSKASHDVALLAQELKQKGGFVKKAPVEINRSFNLFVNLIRMLEDYGGTKIVLSFLTKTDKDSLEDHFTDSPFRNVKALPIVLKINKCSRAADMVSVLNDIYVLEKQTDFKVNEITNDNDILQVKGELYGI